MFFFNTFTLNKKCLKQIFLKQKISDKCNNNHSETSSVCIKKMFIFLK